MPPPDPADPALRETLRKLMKESAAVLALAEPELRDTIGHTNVAVFRQRIEEAAALLAAPRPAEEKRVWVCYDCDKWWLMARVTCECGAVVQPAIFQPLPSPPPETQE